MLLFRDTCCDILMILLYICVTWSWRIYDCSVYVLINRVWHLGWAVDIKCWIELSNDLLIPITVEAHDLCAIHPSTSIFDFPYHQQVNFKQVIPVNGFHLGGGMRLAKDHWCILICMKIHPKADISLLLFAILRWIIISQRIEIMLALCAIH
jgi:hypothetical protein